MKHYEVKVRQTTGGWIWELHDGISPTWIENSGIPFATAEEAARDGARAQALRQQRDAVDNGD
jgi:Glycosyltransferase Family 4